MVSDIRNWYLSKTDEYKEKYETAKADGNDVKAAYYKREYETYKKACKNIL